MTLPTASNKEKIGDLYTKIGEYYTFIGHYYHSPLYSQAQLEFLVTNSLRKIKQLNDQIFYLENNKQGHEKPETD